MSAHVSSMRGSSAQVFLKAGRDGPARGGNPWIFSKAIERLEPRTLEPGAPVEVFDHARNHLGSGYYNPKTTIAVRLLDWGSEPKPLDEILTYRLTRALEMRSRIALRDTDCYRVVNGEGDGLPGLVVDRYANCLVVQILTAGMERMRERVIDQLQHLLTPRAILEHSMGAVRREEGLEDRCSLAAGEPLSEIEVIENGVKLSVDLESGQKTGFFLDQRDNRARFGVMAEGARVLDAFCYSGGFALAALKGNAASVTAVDTSAPALQRAATNARLNGYSEDRAELVRQDVVKFLAGPDRRFDLIVLDPPPLARSQKDVIRAQHLYVHINELGVRALAPGGRLMTFSCSVHFRGEDFIRAVRIACARAGRNMRLLAHLGAGPDHPVLLGHVEGEYLTGLLLGDL
jgi:23S rRNA (cytosine1962-C5)-methyltransferase